MGVNSRRPLLPAPTESIIDTTGSSMTGTDLATDVSRRTDKSSYSIPDDGSPITISTKRRSHKKEEDDTAKLSRTNHQSQTSLLIEYFEGGKPSSRLSSRPSVRVKVIPSGSRRSKDHNNETIQIREGSGSSSSKRHHYTRRISLSTPSKHRTATEPTDDQSNTDDDQTARPLEIEFVERDPGSELSNERVLQPTSEISSMPADSMLDGSTVSGVPRRKRSQSLDKASGASDADLLKAPSRRRSRSLSRERIAYKVAQKLNAGEVASGSRRRSSRNESKEILESDPADLRKRSHRHRSDEQPSVESSLLSGSNVSSHHKSGDAISFRSGTSRSSLNNTKFLETVEDAIRRLILPELKELKKDQTVTSNKSNFERDLPGSVSTPKDDLKRTLSKHSSAPDVSRSSILVADTSNEEVVTPEERRRRHKERRRAKEKTPSPESTIRVRKGSRPENQRAYTDDDMLRRQRSKGLRDAAAAGIVGNVLTTAALSHHDSKSSLGKKSRRRRSSKSSSRTPSIHETETELLFQKHNVPPMPFRSDVDTELTRDSILSQRTDDTETPATRHVQELIRGSPTLATPPRTPLDNQRALTSHKIDHDDIHDRAESPLGHVALEGAAGAIAAAAAGNLLGHHFDDDMLGPGDSNQHPRALSPIQSVASDHDLHETQITEKGQEGEAEDRRYSIASLSSAPSTDLARSTRHEGGNLDSRSEVFRQSDEHGTELGYEAGEPEGSREEHWNEEPLDDQYDDRIDDPAGDAGFTDDEVHMENEGSPRNFTKGVGANPEILNGNPVESVVASLLDPSVLDPSMLGTKSGLSQTRSQADSLNRSMDGSYVEDQVHSRPTSSHRGSPLKYEYDINGHDEKSFTKRLGAASPPQSVTQSEEAEYDDEHYPPDTTIVKEDEEDYGHLPEDDQFQEEESEINTNPSIIQGPIGGHENREHWPYDPTSQTTRDVQLSPAHDSHASAAIAGALGAGLGLAAAEHSAGYDQPYSRAYMDGHIFSTPPGAKDEGYISAANPMSPSNATPEPHAKFSTLDHVNPPLLFDNNDLDDPFVGSGQQRHFSGYSHGMASPIYDSATGRGIESIESKDIIALMNHLTVRDAQRNARDTEMLVTLVRSAAEMRGSFEEMKKYIAQQDEMIIQANEKQHERTRAIGGPRPFPASKSDRQLGQLAAADYGADIQAKRKNVFRRALKSLSMKSSNDLTKIEDMLEQLLDEVEALREAQEGRNVGTTPGTGPASLNSNGHGTSNPDGYEPEGLAGTGSPGDQSAFTSNSSRPVGDTRPVSLRRASENRVSTVPEGDEELDSYEQPLLDREVPYDDRVPARHERGVSEPLGTPPRKPVPAGALSQETTPRKSDEKSRKHKSSSSSFFKISRWSKTTASSVGEGIRNSIQPNRKERPISGVSRSGSDLANQDAYNAGFYDTQGDNRLCSSYTLDEEQQDNRPPSPLVPSQVSEGPVYKAHRDSFNLQHPQPQKGPTDRYQNHLEFQAQDFAPTSPTSERWGSQSSLSRLSANPNRYSGGGARRTPISDMAYSELSSATGPPRPPKVKDAGPLIPQRPPKIKEEDERSQQSASRNNSTKYSPSSQPPQRKPTGPRPITSAGQQIPSNIKRNRYRGSPNQIDYDDDEY